MSKNILDYLFLKSSKKVVVPLPNYGFFMALCPLCQSFAPLKCEEFLFTIAPKHRLDKSVKEQARLVADTLRRYASKKHLTIYGVFEFHQTGDIHMHAFVGYNTDDNIDRFSYLKNYMKRNVGQSFSRPLHPTVSWRDEKGYFHTFKERYDYIHKHMDATGFSPVCININSVTYEGLRA